LQPGAAYPQADQRSRNECGAHPIAASLSIEKFFFALSTRNFAILRVSTHIKPTVAARQSCYYLCRQLENLPPRRPRF
jgi:hypothetical protein